MNATGKQSRRFMGGNRHTLKRTGRQSKVRKVFTNAKLTPEAYRSMKLSHKKSLAAHASN